MLTEGWYVTKRKKGSPRAAGGLVKKFSRSDRYHEKNTSPGLRLERYSSTAVTMQLIFFSYDDPRLTNTEKKRAESIAGISNPLYEEKEKKKRREQRYRGACRSISRSGCTALWAPAS